VKIGVVSDTHNNLKNIETIINLFNDEKVPVVIHTGDISNANTLEKFSKLNSELIGVYGNNDRNESGLKEVAEKNDFQFQEPPRRLSLLDREIVIFHEPDKIDQFLSENKLINVVLYGHTHRYENNTKNGVLYFNPGESAGMQKGSNAVGILDLISLEARRIFF
jgi:putative phosphoesterase